ncbi:hypothetical protein Tco_0616274 [Tanacetum coccineum]
MKTLLLKDRHLMCGHPNTPFELLGKLTKNHPIANVSRDPSRSVSTGKQLQTNVMWCYFDAFLTSAEPKTYKEAMLKPSWIDAIQEEIHEFDIYLSISQYSGPGLQFMTPATSSLGLVPNPIPQQPFNPPTRNDWDRLFQPMFDEYFNPPPSAISPVQVDDTPRAVDIADSPV